jgi:hypothetical protein
MATGRRGAPKVLQQQKTSSRRSKVPFWPDKFDLINQEAEQQTWPPAQQGKILQLSLCALLVI